MVTYSLQKFSCEQSTGANSDLSNFDDRVFQRYPKDSPLKNTQYGAICFHRSRVDQQIFDFVAWVSMMTSHFIDFLGDFKKVIEVLMLPTCSIL